MALFSFIYIFDRPKSVSLKYPSESIKIFSGLRLNQTRITLDKLYLDYEGIPKQVESEQHKI